MSLFPSSPRPTFYAWVAAHAPIWKTQADNIGLTNAQVVTLEAALNQAQDDAQAQIDAAEAAKNATQVASASQAALRTQVSSLIGLIRSKANLSGDLSVWDLAQLPRPTTGTPVPPPAQPTDLKVSLNPTSGALTLSWKASNPPGGNGTSYVIRRKLPAQPNFEFLAVTGAKRFIDATLLAGPDSVSYTVQGQRADSTGPASAVFTVNFGRAPNGELTATVSSDQTATFTQPAPKLAA
jgi:hypothetical protein